MARKPPRGTGLSKGRSTEAVGEPGRVRKYGEGRCTRRTKLPRESYREEGGAKLPGAWRGGWLRARPPFRLQPRDREGAGASGSGSKAEEKPGAPGGGNSFSSSGTSAGTSARTERKQEQARGRVWSPKTERSGSVSAVGGNGGCKRPVGRGGTPRPPAHPAPHTPARLERAGAELLEIWANPKCLCGLSGGERPGGKG